MTVVESWAPPPDWTGGTPSLHFSAISALASAGDGLW